jgi:hypothetical protein
MNNCQKCQQPTRDGHRQCSTCRRRSAKEKSACRSQEAEVALREAERRGYQRGYFEVLGAPIEAALKPFWDDLIFLTHSDHHPPERQELATMVTRELLKIRNG